MESTEAINNTNPSSSAMDNKENGSITSPTSRSSNSSLKQRYLNDAVREPKAEEESENSEENSSDESSVDDPHLSEYERLRLRNIRRNEARLAQLGLLIPGESESQQSAFTTALSIKKPGRPKGYRKRDKNLEPTRYLPRRSAKIIKFDPSFERKEKPKRKYNIRRSTEEEDDGYSSDDTVPASPITLSKIIKPQEHQDDFHDDKKFYLKKRRSRRGRPKRDEYIYVCDEKCSYCSGPWGQILECGTIKEEEKVDDEKKLEPIDIELLDDDEVRLVRCKNCRLAFHPACMRLNGGEVKIGSGEMVCKLEEEKVHPNVSSKTANVGADGEVVCSEDGVQPDVSPKTANLGANESSEAGTGMKVASVADAVAFDDSSSNPVAGTEQAELERDDSTQKVVESKDSSPMVGSSETTKVSTESKSDAKVANLAADSEMEASSVSASAEGSATASSDVSLKEEHADSTADKSQMEGTVQTTESVNEEPKRCRPIRIPKRCCKCNMMRELGIGVAARKEADRRVDEAENSDDLLAPVKTRIAFKLEAIVDGQTVLCSVNPAPTLVADVHGKSIMCRIVFAVESEHDETIDEFDTKPAALVKETQTRKRKNKAPDTKPKDPIARKVDKIVIRATDRITDVKVQASSIDELQKLVDGATSTACLVKAGGLEVLVNAMANHPEQSDIQAQSIKTMTEVIWYCQSLGIDLVEAGCLELTTDAMEAHGTHVEIQELGIELFRALSSFDLECCKAMFEADIIKVVISAMKRNPNELGVLIEASCFIQNMIVVSFDTVDIVLKSKRGDGSVVPVLVNAINKSQDCDGFVTAACDVLKNISLVKKGVSQVVSCGGGQVFHQLLKSNQSPHVSQAAIEILYNLAYTSPSLLGHLAKADCSSSVISTLNSLPKDPSHAGSSFGLLSLLAGADENARQKVSNPSMISLVLDAIRRHANSPDLIEEAFLLLSTLEYHAEDKQLGLAVAKKTLEAMSAFRDEESIQTFGCKILLSIVGAQGELRALKSLLHSTSAKEILAAVPDCCRGAVNALLEPL